METKDVQNDKMQEEGQEGNIAQEPNGGQQHRAEKWLHAVSPQHRDYRGEQ
jgi:hypothetical protein